MEKTYICHYGLPQNLEEMQEYLKFLGEETEETNLGKLLAKIVLKEGEIGNICKETVGLTTQDIREIFTLDTPLKTRQDMLHELIERGKEAHKKKALEMLSLLEVRVPYEDKITYEEVMSMVQERVSELHSENETTSTTIEQVYEYKFPMMKKKIMLARMRVKRD